MQDSNVSRNVGGEMSLKDRIMPILRRVKAREIREIDGLVRAKLWEEEMEYQFIEKDGTIVYYRLAEPEMCNSFTLEEIETIEHFLFPLLKKVKAPKCMDIHRNDSAVRLHLLLPGDTLLATYRVMVQGAGTQITMDYYTVK